MSSCAVKTSSVASPENPTPGNNVGVNMGVNMGVN